MKNINRTPQQTLGNADNAMPAKKELQPQVQNNTVNQYKEHTMQILDVWRIRRLQLIKPVLRRF